MSVFDFEVTTIDGKTTKLESYRGNVLLIVNVASQCGFTPQYEGLEKLYQKEKGRGFTILGFPCNQFGGQEPGNAEEIRSFCDTRYHVTFPLFEKIEVNGPHTHPLYAFLKKQERGIFGTEGIKWNFTKFLLDTAGKVVKRFPPQAKPESIAKDVEPLLPK
jgi:glutathione peroxidase